MAPGQSPSSSMRIPFLRKYHLFNTNEEICRQYCFHFQRPPMSLRKALALDGILGGHHYRSCIAKVQIVSLVRMMISKRVRDDNKAELLQAREKAGGVAYAGYRVYPGLGFMVLQP